MRSFWQARELLPLYPFTRPSLTGYSTSRGLSARNDHYELWINAYCEAYTRHGDGPDICVYIVYVYIYNVCSIYLYAQNATNAYKEIVYKDKEALAIHYTDSVANVAECSGSFSIYFFHFFFFFFFLTSQEGDSKQPRLSAHGIFEKILFVNC